ncbi:putative holin [Pseudomonas knackmussii]|uniref:putative holin n=1 Tax=Pseudomonas knackmussii TaxID=65741 RepID=UPI001F39892E|nr:putative holin [Pseudomonas knackmussii]
MTEPKRRRAPRMTNWTLITVCLLLVLAAIAPTKLPVVLYKVGMVTLAVTLGYWLDRALFPGGRPHDCHLLNALIAAWIRRALIVLACVIGLTLGL